MLIVHNNYTNAVPGVVGNLICAMSSSPSELSFFWELPILLGNEVVSYQVIVNGLEHRPGTRDVVQSGTYNEFVDAREVSIIGLGKDVYCCSEKRTCVIIIIL